MPKFEINIEYTQVKTKTKIVSAKDYESALIKAENEAERLRSYSDIASAGIISILGEDD